MTRGLPPPDPHSLCPLSSTEFVEPPPPGTPLYSCIINTEFFVQTYQMESCVLPGKQRLTVISRGSAAVSCFGRCRRTATECQAPEDGSDYPRWGQNPRTPVAAACPRRRRNSIELFSWGKHYRCRKTTACVFENSASISFETAVTVC